MTFTDYIRALSEDRSAPDLESFNNAVTLLKKALVYEMKKRGLWSGHPRHLGIAGGNRWHEDMLEELVLDAYEFVFVRRLPGLLKQFLVSSDIDSLVFHNLRLFLHERQKQNDPIGYRTFEILHASVEQLCKKATLHILEGDPRIRNETLLGFTPWSSETSDSTYDFLTRVRSWNDELLPGLIDSRGKAKQEIILRLEGFILDLRGDVEAFRFRDLVFPLKNDVRARWTPELLLGEADSVLPDLGYEIWQSFWKLRSCVDGKLIGSEKSGKTRNYLQKLWLFLWNRAAEIEEKDSGIQTSKSGEPRLSDLALSKSLEIPRDRIPGLKKSLGRLALDCREELLAASSSGAVATDRQEYLRDQSRASAARFVQMCSSLEDRRGQALRLGDIFFPPTRPLGVDWLVLEHDPEKQDSVLIPVDDHPLVGSRDVRLPGDETSHARCGVEIAVDVESLKDLTKIQTLKSELIDGIREQRLNSEKSHSSVFEEEVETDSEYVHWMSKLAQAQVVLLETSATRTHLAVIPQSEEKLGNRERKSSAQRRGWGNLLAAAASILLLISVGLIFRQNSKIDDLERLIQESRLIAQQLEEKEKEIQLLLTNQSSEKRAFEEQLSRLRGEAAELERQLAVSASRIEQLELEENLDAPVVVAELSLSSTRGGETLKIRESVAADDLVKIYVDLKGDDNYMSYRAVLTTTTGIHIWTDSELPTRESEFGPEAIVTLRAGQFGSESYILVLEGFGKDGGVFQLGRFRFDVVRSSM